MRILVVEDDALISNAIEAGLKSKAYAVDCLNDGNQALYAPEDIAYDCILLDLGLPGIDGVQLLKKWRANNVRTPVIIITARDGIDDRVQGLDIGADDYVVKPFDLTELLARIRAVTRRTASSNDVVTLSNGVLSLDPISHEVLVKD
ncbi:MAG: response regulator, partial [Succinivibrio sp.]|nr:response regulator [Succinivibrio sp.]